MTGAHAVLAERLAQQGDACEALGSPLYAHLLRRAADDIVEDGPALRVLKPYADLPTGAAIALRLMGAVHRTVLEGRAPGLAPFYPSAGGSADDPEGTWVAFRTHLEDATDELRPLIERPVQTNEVGRSAALLGGFLEVARRWGLPLRLLELGTSAGLNLRWDHFRYEVDTGSWGPEDSPVRLGGFSPGPDVSAAAAVVERAGCDPDPVDPTTDEGRLTLSAYVWPDQSERWTRLQGALEIAERVPASVARRGAGEWLAEHLAEERPGFATVVFHSIMWQYMPADEQQQVRSLLAEAGARGSAGAPLAWLHMEPPVTPAPGALRGGAPPEPNFAAPGFRAEDLADVHLTLWPGGETRLVAKAGYHGRPVVWRGWGE